MLAGTRGWSGEGARVCVVCVVWSFLRAREIVKTASSRPSSATGRLPPRARPVARPLSLAAALALPCSHKHSNPSPSPPPRASRWTLHSRRRAAAAAADGLPRTSSAQSRTEPPLSPNPIAIIAMRRPRAGPARRAPWLLLFSALLAPASVWSTCETKPGGELQRGRLAQKVFCPSFCLWGLVLVLSLSHTRATTLCACDCQRRELRRLFGPLCPPRSNCGPHGARAGERETTRDVGGGGGDGTDGATPPSDEGDEPSSPNKRPSPLPRKPPKQPNPKQTTTSSPSRPTAPAQTNG